MSGNKARYQVRIIGGQWRGRKLQFPEHAALRPTPDRVRETLFNWLAPLIAGSRCLDLFAGSGALGFEAASRGAREVVLVERDARVAQALREQAQAWQASQLQIVQAEAQQYLTGLAHPFDIVLLDPPFGQALLDGILVALTQGWLAQDARIYLEAERSLSAAQIAASLPPGYVLLRSKHAGQVSYHLAGPPSPALP